MVDQGQLSKNLTDSPRDRYEMENRNHTLISTNDENEEIDEFLPDNSGI